MRDCWLRSGPGRVRGQECQPDPWLPRRAGSPGERYGRSADLAGNPAGAGQAGEQRPAEAPGRRAGGPGAGWGRGPAGASATGRRVPGAQSSIVI